MRVRRAGRPDDSGRQGGDAHRDFTAYATQAVPRLRTTAFLMCRDWHLADDLTQTALTKLFVAWPRVSKAEDVDAYARKVLLRSYLDHHRRRSASEVVTSTFDEAGAAESTDLRMTLVDALRLLKPQDRAVIVLRYWEDYSVEQVASLLEIREATVRARSMRALAKLREALGEELVELLA
ncbi:SigE family RNA polymerase sigma factor [Acidothermaceae bacterium B102]|nr:SigE family RNA polymerase sigma factor [Acidothermaceae bacterium B102]